MGKIFGAHLGFSLQTKKKKKKKQKQKKKLRKKKLRTAIEWD
jgi:hypothetical protein